MYSYMAATSIAYCYYRYTYCVTENTLIYFLVFSAVYLLGLFLGCTHAMYFCTQECLA